MELDEGERRGYTEHGHRFLCDLAEKVQGTSSYRERILHGPERSQASDVIIAWLKNRV